MPYTVQQALTDLKELATVQEMRTCAQYGLAPRTQPKVNTHIHLPPNFSAFVSVSQAIDLAHQQGVGVLGVSNYYDYDVYADFVELAKQNAIFPLFGLEIIALLDQLVRDGVKINDPGNPGRIYTCGKGITRFAPMNEQALAFINTIRTSDRERMAKMVAKLSEIFAQRGLPLGLTESAVIDMVVRRHNCPRSRVYLQERHICQAFQEALFAAVPAPQRIAKLTAVFGAAPKAGPDEAVKIQNEIRAHLMKAGKPAFVEEKFLTFEQARQLVLELGGIPCYPTLADGTTPVCPYEDPVEALIERIKAAGLTCAEFIPIRNKPEVLSRYVKAMRAAGLVITAGTEHNTLDLLPIEPACVGGAPVPDDVKDIFWEGACVVAAHQFMVLHNECGFVDSKGRPNSQYKTAEERIEAFRRLGAAVIERYYRVNTK